MVEAKEPSRAERCTIPEAIRYICSADKCETEAARQQFRKALATGKLGQLTWEDTLDPGLVVLDEPPSPDQHWDEIDVDWEAGTVRDAWGTDQQRKLVLLVCRVALRKFWPEMYPLADSKNDPDQYEAQGTRRARKIREEEEQRFRAWNSVWNAERAKPVQQRSYFSAAEIADELAIHPNTLVKDAALRDRIIGMMIDWVMRREFDLGAGEVVELTGDPPVFVPLSPVPPEDLFLSPEALILRRDAIQRFVEANGDLPSAPPFLQRRFGTHGVKPNTGTSFQEELLPAEEAMAPEKTTAPKHHNSIEAGTRATRGAYLGKLGEFMTRLKNEYLERNSDDILARRFVNQVRKESPETKLPHRRYITKQIAKIRAARLSRTHKNS